MAVQLKECVRTFQTRQLFPNEKTWMAKTRKTTKVAKKQKPSATSPLEILLEFKRNPSDEETTVEGLAVAAENDNIPKEFVDEKVDQIIVDEEAVFVGIDDAAIAEIPVAEAMPVTTMETTKTDEKEMEIDIKTLSTSTQTDPQSIPEVLLSTSQSSYQTLLQKYNLLKSIH